MKLIDADPFSNGTEYMLWEDRNCDKCVKNSHLTKDQKGYTKIICAIQRDIFSRMYSNKPISQRTLDICKMADCPYRQEHRPKRNRLRDNLPTLF